VKRTAILALSVLALAAVVYAGRIWARPNAPAAPAASAATPPRIALLNLSYVINNYEKIKTYRDEMKSAIEPFSKREATIKKTAEGLLKDAQAPTTPAARKEAIDKELKKLQRDMEDLKNEFNQMIGKKQEQQALIVYADVRNVAQRYAQSHGIDLVLHYNDATEEKEYWSPQNVVRKMQAGALMPLYYSSGMDISAEVLKLLNGSYRAAPATGPPAAAPAGTRR
jgi:Skp family chaperone for outer membrane proteins